MTRTARPNDPCPCGSGTKFKKCCGSASGKPAAPPGLGGGPHTVLDRDTATAKLVAYIEARWAAEEQDAQDVFWDEDRVYEAELPPDFLDCSRSVSEPWCVFDYQMLDDDTRFIDHFLAEAKLSPGERFYLQAMAASTMHFYEVEDTLPGTSVTLRDLLEGDRVRVNERTASRTLTRGDTLAVRVIPRGSSGGPEMERGLVPIPKSLREKTVATLQTNRAAYFAEVPGATVEAFYKALPPFFHHTWLSAIFQPVVPTMVNGDGDRQVWTRTSFSVKDPAALAKALRGGKSAGVRELGDDTWEWVGPRAQGTGARLGGIALEGGELVLECDSVERQERGRVLLEKLAGAAIRHKETSRRDFGEMLKKRITDQALGRLPDDEPTSRRIDADVADIVVLDHMDQHYRSWVDGPVPALDGLTPRDAAGKPAYRARVVALLRGLDEHYVSALRRGEPAYDPSWMGAELGVQTESPVLFPPPLAHERATARLPGSRAACRAVADRLRRLEAFESGQACFTDGDIERDPELAPFLDGTHAAANETDTEGGELTPFLRLMVQHELHGGMVFWPEEGLSYLMDHTRVDLSGADLEGVGPSSALVFTDRYALSLAERFLARQAEDPLRGQRLRVMTAYVTEVWAWGDRTLDLTLAFDAGGADVPSLWRFDVPGTDEDPLEKTLQAHAPNPAVEGHGEARTPLHRLLRTVLHTLVLTASEGVQPEPRTAAAAPARPPGDDTPRSAQTVFFLATPMNLWAARTFHEQDPSKPPRAFTPAFWKSPTPSAKSPLLRWTPPAWKLPRRKR